MGDTILECGNGAYEHCKKTRNIATPVTITPTLVGADLCTRGPAHWCSSLENMFECGIGAYEHCKKEKEQHNGPVLLGQDKCTSGPSYWCQNMETILECGNGVTTRIPTLPSNKTFMQHLGYIEASVVKKPNLKPLL